MSPRTSTLLALIGVLLAGIPLPALTAARREAPATTAAVEPAATRTAYATLHWSGQPTELELLHEGRELARLNGAELATTPWEGELPLPAATLCEGGVLDVEIIATWPEGGQAQAVSLTLEPDGLPAQQRTAWAPGGSATLHTLFSFSW